MKFLKVIWQSQDSELAKSTCGSSGASTFSKTNFLSSLSETTIVDPALYLPSSSSSDNGSSNNLWIDLLSGLAPNSLSYPSVAKNSLASSESTISRSEFF